MSDQPVSVIPFLHALASTGGSDLHCKVGSPPRVRIDGRLRKLQTRDLTSADTEQMVNEVLREDLVDDFLRTNEADFAYSLSGVGRFRVNAFRSRGSAGLVFRRVSVGAIPLQDLGLPPVLASLAMEPRGLVLVTGPTGSGKTTTLYAALSEIKSIEDKIVTIEDPVEYQLRGITQIPINEKKGLTFARGLRSILRHDPDKIMVGEIRDPETAQIAIQSALTGHLVFTTVHANNVFDVLGRFLNMGVEPYQFISALNCVMAQRLVRRICEACRREVRHTPEVLIESALNPALAETHVFVEGAGCIECGGTGFKGRMAICELLDLTDHIREIILDRRPISEVKRAAKEQGMRFLRESAVERVMHGLTTLREINKVTFVE